MDRSRGKGKCKRGKEKRKENKVKEQGKGKREGKRGEGQSKGMEFLNWNSGRLKQDMKRRKRSTCK